MATNFWFSRYIFTLDLVTTFSLLSWSLTFYLVLTFHLVTKLYISLVTNFWQFFQTCQIQSCMDHHFVTQVLHTTYYDVQKGHATLEIFCLQYFDKKVFLRSHRFENEVLNLHSTGIYQKYFHLFIKIRNKCLLIDYVTPCHTRNCFICS